MHLVFATHNNNKAQEIQKLLPITLKVLTLSDINCQEDIPETADTLEGNALIKARYIWNTYQTNCFADDTGLEIEALNGAPGVFSARYAGEGKNSNDNMDLVLRNLAGQENRKAQFRTVIVLIIDGNEFLFEGIAPGEITSAKSGSDGFGYDPIFKPISFEKTFAEMSMEEKNKISHRGKAIRALVDFLNSREKA